MAEQKTAAEIEKEQEEKLKSLYGGNLLSKNKKKAVFHKAEQKQYFDSADYELHKQKAAAAAAGGAGKQRMFDSADSANAPVAGETVATVGLPTPKPEDLPTPARRITHLDSMSR